MLMLMPKQRECYGTHFWHYGLQLLFCNFDECANVVLIFCIYSLQSTNGTSYLLRVEMASLPNHIMAALSWMCLDGSTVAYVFIAIQTSTYISLYWLYHSKKSQSSSSSFI